ncbi:MAG: YceI family protein [Bacteroidetes bacterium]|nr:YceI family protein [Bacteroidota bacterium]MBU1486180.1 YceI family protein [Bacteroidota bacterium]MBU2046977.1 YceI family protein [Bacteroidota bacterium]MBU2267058.1 YceI family protein [Bacteroidota bacterium]MBU2376350.1 YceI family protein [Bacteroidota bacterium]
MKKNLFALFAIIGVFFAFKPATDVYTVDVSKSKIEWIGRKVTGQHAGELKLATGTLSSSGKTLTGGSFVIDMTSISNTDLDAGSAQKLLGHLKSEDFFSTEKNPTANFNITNIKSVGADKVTITGNLTIKGITNEVAFPATVRQKGNILVAVANGVKIDRTKFDIKYGSKSFIDGIGDKAIDNEFELNINLVAIK